MAEPTDPTPGGADDAEGLAREVVARLTLIEQQVAATLGHVEFLRAVHDRYAPLLEVAARARGLITRATGGGNRRG